MKSHFSARNLVLPCFTLSQVCTKEEDGSQERKIVTSTYPTSIEYHYKPVDFHNGSRDPFQINRMPVVVDGEGAPWQPANLYILSLLRDTIAVRMDTYRGIGLDLSDFKKFLEEEQVDYQNFPQKKWFRPTYRYRKTMQSRIEEGAIAHTTARRRMLTVIRFYRWLVSENFFKPEYPLWQENEVYIAFSDRTGQRIKKPVKVTDLKINTPKWQDPYAETIDDGGKLRPLSHGEQELLCEALISLGNTEMTLIHLLALTTGARMQTILTMRIKHVQTINPEGLAEIRIPVGLGTGIDTKFDKKMVIFIPAWLYKKLTVYSYSDRATKRRKKAGDNSIDQYLFLSNRGVPFYRSKSDRNQFEIHHALRHEKNGQTVRQFITDRIIPLLKTRNKSFHYRFHDLRATFGMNLTEQQLGLVESRKITLHKAREFVRTRMGHASATTTDGYLNYQHDRQHAANAQLIWEKHLQELADKINRDKA